jgi:hypothetical protein
LKQVNIGNWWGMLVTLLGRVGFYAQMVSLILVAFFAYPSVSTSVDSWFGIAMPFWLFLLIIVLLPFIGMIFEYIFGFPSFIAFNNQQSYKHGNPLRVDIEILKADSVENKKDMEKIKEKLGIEK